MRFFKKVDLRQLMSEAVPSQDKVIARQNASSDEAIPAPSSEKQSQAEVRLVNMRDRGGRKHGWNRRQFFESASGMVAVFVAINDTFSATADVRKAEAPISILPQEEDLSWVSDLAEIPAPVRGGSQDRLVSHR
jgi:hypothetical protein